MNNWRIAYHREWLDKHPEFNQQCKTKEELSELQQVCMAYIRKLLKSSEIGKLPYDKHRRIDCLDGQNKINNSFYNEQELLAQVSAPEKSESLFEDMHDNINFPARP